MSDLRVTAVSPKASGDCRGEQLEEFAVSYTISGSSGGKSFEVQVFHGEKDGWYTMTAHLDNAIAAWSGKDYFSMSGESRRKVRKELAEKIVRLTRKFLNK